jgi:hypothetical protein
MDANTLRIERDGRAVLREDLPGIDVALHLSDHLGDVRRVLRPLDDEGPVRSVLEVDVDLPDDAATPLPHRPGQRRIGGCGPVEHRLRRLPPAPLCLQD